MDFVNLSTSMTMLELIRFLLQERNDSFSFYSGKLGNFNIIKEDSESGSKFKISTVCQHICKRVREVWLVQNVGIIAGNDDVELMICVTSTDPSVPAEVVSFMVEAMAVCSVNLFSEQSRITDNQVNDELMDEDNISSDLIQINASMKEINERIEQFIRQKREQADLNNVLDFCTPTDRQCCARVDAMLVRKKNSSSHLAGRHILDRYTKKYNESKQERMQTLTNVMKTSQEAVLQSQFLPSSASGSSSLIGEKRTFDIASLESRFENDKKQQKL